MFVAPQNASIYRFGLFELDLRAAELRKNGVKLRLQDQPRQILVQLLVHSGELEAIRVGRSFRVPEAAVNQYLRAAFVGTG